jgi:predicted dithiol-disulfide oxidoreductase (DUF899 family)
MCPACIATTAWIAAGAGSTAGIAALAVRRVRGRKPNRKESEMKEATSNEKVPGMPGVASREAWLRARKALLDKEKALNRQRDALAAERRALPLVRIEKEYAFEGPDGRRTLGDLFAGRRQLIVYHFMFDPSWDEGCPACSFVADHFDGALAHLAARDTSFAVVSRAPIAKIERFRKRMGWNFPWLSSFGGDFNYDFQVTLDEDHAEYNYAPVAAQPEVYPREGEREGLSVFVRDGERLYHSYSTYQRGVDPFLNTYNFLDHTPLGRQEEDGIMRWVRHHDRY